jgi:hypothetical protein
MTSRPSTVAPILAVLAIVLPFALYVGGYLSLVRSTDESGVVEWANDLPYDFTCAPHYRVGGQFARVFFWPAHSVDLNVRPDYWTMNLSYPGAPVVDLDA